METSQLITLLLQGTKETLYMTVVSTLCSYLIGIPAGVVLFVTDQHGITTCRPVHIVLGTIINLMRSIPFIILLIAILPFTRFLVGTTIGSTATIVPLVVAAAPFIARMVESSLKEVDGGIIEAALAMGAAPLQMIRKVLLPEAKPSLLVGGTIAITTILGYSAMAGFVGGGGLGALAINYGYHRYQTNIMLLTVVFLVIIVQIFQELGMKLVSRVDKRIKKS